ncbi:39S ribosomal protein L11, mitochondrial-like [Penaeus japonicus]|uniref:39S ribosomal protein L11, mitochondrial-like n=1 Tax=Penaeus japonicus TaxID=27405 RepID=UPI001C7106BC|nr:39S ribosomal protein L11, mitochondrial-like [Penaeus japonicus]
MAKAGGKMKALKKVVEKVNHGNLIRTNIPAGMAVAGPPLGPMLGQRGLNIAAFCKDFNARTAHYKNGVPLPCRIQVRSDRSYELTIHNPPTTFFLKQAAGIQRGAMSPGREIAGKVSLKHIYEIAKIKQQDPPLQLTPLKQICELTIGVAHSIGLEVVREVDPEEYSDFLKNRTSVVEEQLKELQEKKEAKMLRK